MEVILAVLSNTTLWTGTAFAIFIMLCVKYLKSFVVKYLEDYARESSQALIQAKKANRDAKQLLDETVKKEEEAKQEIEEMFEKSKKDARTGILNANKELKVMLKKEEELARKRVKIEKARVISEVKTEIIEQSFKELEAKLSSLSTEVRKSKFSENLKKISL